MSADPTRRGPTDLLLLSRAPVAGQTKTRLAASIGAARAAAFHAACLQDLLDVAEEFRASVHGEARAEPGARCHLFIEPPGSEAAFAAAGMTWPGHVQVHGQAGAGLGGRMAHAFKTVFHGEQPAGRAVLLGSDLPLVTAAALAHAARALDGADVVLGPTPDGGYWLVGLRAPCPDLFALPAWGHGGVLEQTLARATALGLTTARAATLPDVDTAADLPRVAAHPLFGALPGRRAVRMVAELLRGA